MVKPKKKKKISGLPFAVFVGYQDGDDAVYLFKNKSAARDFLKGAFEAEVKIDIENEFEIEKAQIADDGNFAVIRTPGGKTTYSLAAVYK